MPQKKKSDGTLGQMMIKDRFKSKGKTHQWLTPAEAVKTDIPSELLLKSITAPSDLDEFLATATLAGTEFEAERHNLKLITPNPREGVLTAEEQRAAKTLQDSYRRFLTVPRRPKWNASTTPQQLDEAERKGFLEWRKQLTEIADIETLIVTPYERNLEVWKQLWRVLERSDIVVQIVDARNPLLYYCEDLAKYVNELNPNKDNFVLVNKADLLPDAQRETWAEYFRSVGLNVVFFSALLANEENVDSKAEMPQKNVHEADPEAEIDSSVSGDSAEEESDDDSNLLEPSNPEEDENKGNGGANDGNVGNDGNNGNSSLPKPADEQSPPPSESELFRCSSKLYSREELIKLLKRFHGDKPTAQDHLVTVGFVGYPNVGKSSTLNGLLQLKKVSVSAIPGKTKHFQTMYLDDELMLCDCPGLVMPSFAMNAAEMVVSGILPIDQLRDHVPAVNLVCSRIPRYVLESTYGIQLPLIKEYGVEYHIIPPPSAEEFLNAYASLRGFVTARGLPDASRVARHVLRDYVNGKLLFCHAPPTIPQEVFFRWEQLPETQPAQESGRISDIDVPPVLASLRTKSGVIDRDFFAAVRSGFHEKTNTGNTGQSSQGSSQNPGSTKRHFKKNKKEKLRRIYRELDVH